MMQLFNNFSYFNKILSPLTSNAERGNVMLFSTSSLSMSIFDSDSLSAKLNNLDINNKEDFIYFKDLKLDRNISLFGKTLKKYCVLGPADSPFFKNKIVEFLNSLQESQPYAVFFRIPTTDGGFITTHKQIVLNKNMDPDIMIARIINSLNYWESFYEVSTSSTVIAEYFPFNAALDRPKNKVNVVPNITVNSLGFNSKFLKNKNIPLSMDLSKYGILVDNSPEFNNNLNIKTYLNKSTRFVLEEIDSSSLFVKVYDKSNLKVLEYTDINYGDYFIRIIADLYIKIDHYENILYVEKTYNTKFVKKAGRDLKPENKILTFDIEAFLYPIPKENYEILGLNDNNDKILKQFIPFSCGFYDGEKVYKYYLTDYKTYKDMLKDCILDMANPIYDDYTIYVHNGGGFDFIFILDVLKDFSNEELLGKPKFTGKDSKVIGFNVDINCKEDLPRSKKYNGTNLKFRDSYKLLPHSLRNLTNEFKVENIKGNFPYLFPNVNNLEYIGDKPDIKFYQSKELIELKYAEIKNNYKNKVLFDFDLINEIDKKYINFNDLVEFKAKKIPDLRFFKSEKLVELAYNDINTNNWNLKEECLKYLDSDLIGLYEVLMIFHGIIYNKYRLNITKFYSISSLAMKIFTSNFLKSESIIPIINNRKVHKDIRNALYGGRVEVITPIVTNYESYDINSIYPWAMTKPLPIGSPIFSSNTNLNELFGIVYATVYISDLADPVLPKRTPEGGLIFPRGTWTAWFFSEELKNSLSYGVKVTVHHSYIFEKSYDLFKEFVQELFELKRTSTDSKRAIYKLIMNSSYGRWALKFYKSTMEVLDKKEADNLMLSHNVEDYIEYQDEKIFLRYSILPDYNDCLDNNIDYNTELIKTANSQNDSISSIPIGVAITAWARIHMSQFLFDPANPCAYTDTDCGVFPKPLSSKIVNDLLGGWKLEHKIRKGLFPLDKVYMMDTLKGNIIKNKGVSNKLTYNDFINLYKGISINVTELRWIRDLSYGIVYLNDTDIHIFSNYSKRNKIFNKGFWIGTEPLTILNDKIIHKTVLANFTFENYLYNYKNEIYISRRIYYFTKIGNSLIPFKEKSTSLIIYKEI